ncbi:unnamed protein product [Acidocella sp. C78]|uniref:hypothetical protein n=1 Tax=Acidocella sp. C78 TaxID=1671486 RepID=UPI00191BC8E5|nr:hypothetical protein [Acidocella sp. C78]CAG4926298.1 unnamed protein product [Acidocella sp. C78]
MTGAATPFGLPLAHAPEGMLTSSEFRDATIFAQPFGLIDGNGRVVIGPVAATPPLGASAARVVALEAGAAVPLGRFLGPALACGLIGRRVSGGLKLAGPALTPAQRGALDMLGLDGAHLPFDHPFTFAGVIATLGPARDAGASRLMRIGIDALRFTVEPYPHAERIALVRPGPFAELLASRGFARLDPFTMRIDDTPLGLPDLVAILAAARVVAIDQAAEAPLLGFCDPGGLVIAFGAAVPPARGWAALGMLRCRPATSDEAGLDTALAG